MSAMTQFGTTFSTRRAIPLDSGLYHNPAGYEHFAKIRKQDFVVAVQRTPPRPLPPRDQHRAYNTAFRQRKQFHSYGESRSTVARIQPRSIDTHQRTTENW